MTFTEKCFGNRKKKVLGLTSAQAFLGDFDENIQAGF